MKHCYFAKFIVLFLSLGLWSCAPYHHTHNRDAADPGGFIKGELVTTVMEDGEPLTVNVNEVLRDPDRLRSVLESYADRNPDGEPGTIKSSVEDYEEYPDDESDLSSLIDELQDAAAEGNPFPVQIGISAGDAKAFIKAAALTLDQNGQFINGVKVDVVPKGKTHAYSYNDEKKGGYIENEVVYDIFVNGSLVTQFETYLAVGIEPGTYFDVEPFSGKFDDPFPGIPMELSHEAKKEIKKRHLKHKLYAEGTGIVVLGYYENGVLLDRSDPAYTSTEDSCIDWMFKPYPPAHFSDLPELLMRCLGRCKHPRLFNSK